MSSFSSKRYNALPEINDAHEKLSEALEAKKKKLGSLIEDPAIRDLFAYRDPTTDYKFGICILHRHYTITEGERMVSSVESTTVAMITEPINDSTNDSICADRWMHDGFEFEHTRLSSTSRPIQPPPPDFFDEFRRICREYNVDGILGICTADLPSGIDDASGYIILEQPHPTKPRSQTTTLVSLKNIDDRDRDNLRQSAWVPVRRPSPPLALMKAGGAIIQTHDSFTMSCLHNCTNHFVPLRGPTLKDKIKFKFTPDLVPSPRGYN